MKKPIDLQTTGEKDFDETFKRALKAAGGKVEGKGQSMAEVTRALAKGIVDYVEIIPLPRDEGTLRVRFEDGRRYETHFSSYHSLQWWLAREQSLQGVMLLVNGQDAGFIGPKNPALHGFHMSV